MTFLDRFWLRLPVLGRAVLIGVAAAAAGTLPWAASCRRTSIINGTAVVRPLMAIYLWLYWRYLVREAGWPRSTADARRMNARANALSPEAWGLALLAGLLGLASVLFLHGTLGRVVALPP